MRWWTGILICWPALLILLPFQPLLISLVGLRGNVYFLPLLLLGSRLTEKDLRQFAFGLVPLNLIAMAFGAAEYFLGVPRFYPFSAVTSIIYNSRDVQGGYYRIPATFTSAHAYGGMMLGSLPFLIGLWSAARRQIVRIMALAGIGMAMLGILMSATRVNFVLGSLMILITLFASKANIKFRIALVLLIVLVGYSAATNVRFQRFESLSDTENVTGRIAGSVNRGFWEILVGYPMGNGLGGGGTSIPYFLEGNIRNPIGMENEYARILCEQGIIGLLLWLSFVVWFLSRVRTAFRQGSWSNGARLAFCYAAILLGTAWLGVGLFTAIPQTIVMCLAIGWSATPCPDRVRVPARQVPAGPPRWKYAAELKQV